MQGFRVCCTYLLVKYSLCCGTNQCRLPLLSQVERTRGRQEFLHVDKFQVPGLLYEFHRESWETLLHQVAQWFPLCFFLGVCCQWERHQKWRMEANGVSAAAFSACCCSPTVSAGIVASCKFCSTSADGTVPRGVTPETEQRICGTD